MRVAVEGHVNDPFTLEQVCGGLNAMFAVKSIVSSKQPLDMVIFYGIACTARVACVFNYMTIPNCMARFEAKDLTHPVIAFYHNQARLKAFERLLSYMAHALLQKRIHAMPLPESLVFAFVNGNTSSSVANIFVRQFNLNGDNTFLIFAYACRRKMQKDPRFGDTVQVMTEKLLKHRFKTDPWDNHDYYRQLFSFMQAYTRKMAREYFFFVRSSSHMKSSNDRIMWTRNCDHFVDWLQEEYDFDLDETRSPKKFVNTVIMMWLQHLYAGGIGINTLARILECMPNQHSQNNRIL